MIVKIVILNTLSLLIFLTSAHAYLDPGTGSIILQAIIGAIAAAATFLKFYWYRVLKFLGIKEKNTIDQKNNKEDKK